MGAAGNPSTTAWDIASFAGNGAFGKLKCNQKEVLTRLTASTTNGGGALTGGGTGGGW